MPMYDVRLTFNQVPYSPTGKHDRKRSNVCFCGFAYDMGSTHTSGQRLAPWAVREAGIWRDGMHSIVHDVDPVSGRMIVDAGDLSLVAGSTSESLLAIEQRAAELFKNTDLLLSIGGDHSITYEIVRAIVGTQKERDPVTIVSLDSGMDIEPSTYLHHTAWARWAIDSGLAERIVVVGVRGWESSAQDIKWAEKNDVYLYPSTDLNWRKRLQEEVDDTGTRIYLTVDMSVVEPGMAPGVALPAPGGLTARELLSAVHMVMSSGKVCAADVVEVLPDRDPDRVTAKLANRVLAQMLTSSALAPS